MTCAVCYNFGENKIPPLANGIGLESRATAITVFDESATIH